METPMPETHWTRDEPGKPPRILTEPFEQEPLEEPDAWSNDALATAPEPARSTCLRCGGGPLTDWDPECTHVTRESIRERLRGEVLYWTGAPGCQEECIEFAGIADRSVQRCHPTRVGAIDLVLDALTEREIERMSCHPLEPGHPLLTEPVAVPPVTSMTPVSPAAKSGPQPTLDEMYPEPRPFRVGDVVGVVAGRSERTVGRVLDVDEGIARHLRIDTAPGWLIPSAHARRATPAERTTYEQTQARAQVAEDESAHPPIARSDETGTV
jgi:hypothetical protein